MWICNSMVNYAGLTRASRKSFLPVSPRKVSGRQTWIMYIYKREIDIGSVCHQPGLPKLSPVISSLSREWVDRTAWSGQPCLTAVLVFLRGPSSRPVAGWFSSKGLLHRGPCLWSRLSENLSSLLNLADFSWC